MGASSGAVQLGGDIKFVSVPHVRQNSTSCQGDHEASVQRGGAVRERQRPRDGEVERGRERE